MLFDYVQASNDRSILTRALPLAEREFVFWATNRTLNVTSPFTNKTYQVSRYAVNNTGPRPESYLTGANIPILLVNRREFIIRFNRLFHREWSRHFFKRNAEGGFVC